MLATHEEANIDCIDSRLDSRPKEKTCNCLLTVISLQQLGLHLTKRDQEQRREETEQLILGISQL